MEKMKVLFNGKLIEAAVVGAYGTFGDPIVEVDGEESVVNFAFIDPETGETLADCCQSVGCDFCSGDHTGCRNGIYRDYPVVAIA